MSFFNSPIVMCSLIALGIVFILVMVVVICCKRSNYKEREELKALSEEIESDTLDNEVNAAYDDKIESVLSKMQEAMEMKEEVSVSFEQEQEENAIISYQELLASFGAKSSIDVDSIEVFDDELESKVEISDINKEIIDAYQRESLDKEIYRFQNDYSSQEMPMEVSAEAPVMNFQELDYSSSEVVEDVTPTEEVYQAKHVVGNGKFKSSQFISPVYGIVRDNTVSKVEEVEEIIFDDEKF